MVTSQEKNVLPNSSTKIGERLYQIRLYLDKTQDEFAKILGVNRASIIRYEKGERKMDTEILDKIESMLFNINWLLSGSGEMLQAERSRDMVHEEPTNIYVSNMALAKIRELDITLDVLRNFIVDLEQEIVTLNDTIRERFKKEGLDWKKPMI